MKIIKQLLIKNEKIGACIVQIILAGIIIMRLQMALKTASFIDARFFVEAANFIRKGISPYHSEEFLSRFPGPPLQSPSMSFLSMPLCYLPEYIQHLLFFIGGFIVSLLFVIVVFHYYGFKLQDYIKPYWKNIPICLVITLIFISAPVLMMLREGQNSCFAALFLFIVLFYPKRDKNVNVFLLSLAAAFKYSLLTLSVPVLLFQKRWKMGIIAFILFIFMVLAVGLWLNGIVPAIKEYIQLVIEDTKDGFNSYEKNSFTLVSIGFFKCKVLNSLMRIVSFMIFIWSMFKIWHRNLADSERRFPDHLTAIEWGFITTMTMFISYHRVHDCILFMPFVSVVLLEAIAKKNEEGENNVRNYLKVIYFSVLLLFWAVPQSFVFSVESWIGRHFQSGEQVFWYSQYKNYMKMFPATKLIMLSMVCVFTYLLFTQSVHMSNSDHNVQEEK